MSIILPAEDPVRQATALCDLDAPWFYHFFDRLGYRVEDCALNRAKRVVWLGPTEPTAAQVAASDALHVALGAI